MPRVLILNDPHYSRTPPECRADTYPREILDKFHEVARIAEKLRVPAIGCSGDWFHRKGKVTFHEANDLLAVLRGWQDRGLQPFGILGNHDIAGHALESMDTRAVGSLVHSRILHLLDHSPFVLSDDDGTLHVTGTSYFHGCDDTDENRVRMYGAEPPEDTTRLHVHLAHGTLIQSGEFFDAFTVAPELIKLLHDRGRLPDVIVSGHLHYDEGVKLYPRPDGRGKVAIARIGSLARVASDDLDRQPHVLLIASKGRGFVCKVIPIGKPAKRSNEGTGEGQDPRETEQRIQGFVRVLREEAESWALTDNHKLISEIAQRLGHDDEIAKIALGAVERRQ